MEEEKVIPSADNVETNDTDTIPETENTEKISTVSIKFNKEKRDIPLSEAAVLAQKGLKYELIQSDFERLKTLAQKSGKSIGEYLSGIEQKISDERRAGLMEQTGGNRELTDYIMSLEGEKGAFDNGFCEVKAMFPEIKQIGELPEEVLCASEESGKNLLDTYLRYLLKERRRKEEAKNKIAAANRAGIGSLKTGCRPEENAASIEFLKGLWSK